MTHWSTTSPVVPMLVATLFASLGCSQAPPVSPQAETPPATRAAGSPVSASATAHAARLSPPIPLVGICEASAAAKAPDGTIRIFDDDQPDMVFAWIPEQLPVAVSLRDSPIRDPEGATMSPSGHLWVTGSLSRSKKGKVGKRATVAQLGLDSQLQSVFATRQLRPGTDTADLQPLLDAIQARCPACKLQHSAAGRHDGVALDIEGLSWGPANHLYFGLRAPLVDSHAIVFSVDTEHLTAQSPLDQVIVEAWSLDLGGRGVRGLGQGEDGALLILAGSSDGARSVTPALYRWVPSEPPALLRELPGLASPPEAVVSAGPNTAWVFIDRGKSLQRQLVRGGPHAQTDSDGLEFKCGAGQPGPDDWSYALRVNW